MVAQYGEAARFDLVFHGGSGSELHEIHEALDYGVVKMNLDTDTQYAFTRPIAGYMFNHYDGVLKVDGEVGDKKTYDPRTWLSLGEGVMAKRVQAGGDRTAGFVEHNVQGMKRPQKLQPPAVKGLLTDHAKPNIYCYFNVEVPHEC